MSEESAKMAGRVRSSAAAGREIWDSRAICSSKAMRGSRSCRVSRLISGRGRASERRVRMNCDQFAATADDAKKSFT